MVNYEEVLNRYLSEDGKERDIIADLADPLNIMVASITSRNSLSSIIVQEDCKLWFIYINLIGLEKREINFIIAYQIASIIKSKKKSYSSEFSGFSFDSEEFHLALKIYNRIYKDDEKIINDVKRLVKGRVKVSGGKNA